MTDRDLERARELLPCVCSEAHTSRGLVAPDCPLHQYGEDIVEVLAEARDEAYERAAEECDEEMRRCGAYSALAVRCARRIRELKRAKP